MVDETMPEILVRQAYLKGQFEELTTMVGNGPYVAAANMARKSAGLNLQLLEAALIQQKPFKLVLYHLTRAFHSLGEAQTLYRVVREGE